MIRAKSMGFDAPPTRYSRESGTLPGRGALRQEDSRFRGNDELQDLRQKALQLGERRAAMLVLHCKTKCRVLIEGG